MCKHNPAELLAAISSLAETCSITVTASFSHVSADADSPFVCASAFGGGESSLRLRKSPWHQSDISRFAVKLTMTEVKSNEIGPTQAANNTARIIYTISEGLHFPSTCYWEKKVEIIGRTWNALQIKSFNHESTLLAQRNASTDWYIVISSQLQNQTPNGNTLKPRVANISCANTIQLNYWQLFPALLKRIASLWLPHFHWCPFPFHLCLPVRRRVQSPSSEVSLAPNRQTPRFDWSQVKGSMARACC